MRKIKTWRDPFDEGFSPTHPREITINEGLTVLVGCNGAGKTTLLQNIADVLRQEGLPFCEYNNLSEGGSNGISEMLYGGDMSYIATAWCSSEGENITVNMLRRIPKIREFIETGKYKKGMIDWSFLDEKKEERPVPKERWILLDAIDSGYSIDNVIDLKCLLKEIQQHCKELGIACYIVASANEYELANGEECFDVNTGKYIRFKNYEDYRKFIMKSREKKDKRIQRVEEKGKKDEVRAG